jgi:hypothetical protein
MSSGADRVADTYDDEREREEESQAFNDDGLSPADWAMRQVADDPSEEEGGDHGENQDGTPNDDEQPAIQGNARDAAVVEANDVLSSFDDIVLKDFAISKCKKLPLADLPQISKRGNIRPLTIPQLYNYWDKLNDKQKLNVRAFWSKLDLRVRKSINQQVIAEGEAQAAAARNRSEATTVDDKARLLALRAEPSEQATWGEALNTHANDNRQLIDALHSHATQ